MSPAEGDRLVIMARYPQVGVKSRLAATVGTARALEVYRQLLDHTLELVLQCTVRRIAVELHLTPPGMVDTMASEYDLPFKVYPQSRGDLGRRIFQALQNAHWRGADRLVVIGSDCPYLKVAHLVEAFSALELKEAVLGPARDGGYYLIGLREPLAFPFQSIPWSTPQVLDQTLTALEAHGMAYQLLETLEDVDEATALERYERVKPEGRAQTARVSRPAPSPTLEQFDQRPVCKALG